MTLLIGSRALQIVRPDLLQREPQDFDLMGTYEEFQALQDRMSDIIEWVRPNPLGTKVAMKTRIGYVEFEFAWEGSTTEKLIQMVEANCDRTHIPHIGKVLVSPLLALFALKSSHRFVSGPQFRKTLDDWHALRRAGASVPSAWAGWLKERSQETYARKHPKLNVSKKQFFNPDEVDYIYDHDSIHRAVAYGEKPAYTLFQRPGTEVACDRGLFETLPLENQLHSVAEESYVLAIERSHVPYGTLTPREAFTIALEKVCSTISSGWWREFAYQNYYKVWDVYRDDYLERFHAALADGRIPPFQK